VDLLAKEIHRLIKQQAGDTDFDDLEDPLQSWMAQLADELVKAEEGNLEKAAQELGIDGRPPDTARAQGWARMIARRLLHFGCDPTVVGDPEHETFLRLAEILKRATHTLSDEKRKKVARQYFPMWVHPDAVRQVRPLATSGQAIAVNASAIESGREYADRATFGLASSSNCIVVVSDIHDGNPGMIFDRYHKELVEHFYLHEDVPEDWDDPALFAEWVRALEGTRANKSTDIFVVLHKDGCDASVLRRLRERYPPFTFLLLVGPKAAALARLDPGTVTLLQPSVAPDHERDIRQKFSEFA